jgi:hypothetical protein
MTPFTRQSELAHEARELIVRMPSTAGNLSLVLDGLIETINGETWADFSAVLQAMDEAQAALQEARTRKSS